MTDKTCPAALNLAGEHFACDWPTDDTGQHRGWSHANSEAQAIWTDDSRSMPTMPPHGSVSLPPQVTR